MSFTYIIQPQSSFTQLITKGTVTAFVLLQLTSVRPDSVVFSSSEKCVDNNHNQAHNSGIIATHCSSLHSFIQVKPYCAMFDRKKRNYIFFTQQTFILA